MLKFCIKETNYLSHGNKGLFASVNIKNGELILQCLGEKISFDEAISKGELQSNTLQVGEKEYIDFQEPGVLVNHSCSPNAGINNSLKLIAIKDIFLGEEITFDYSTTMDEDYWTMQCFCGEKSCRKIIKDFKYLSKELQEKYLKLSIVQDFIVKKYNF